MAPNRAMKTIKAVCVSLTGATSNSGQNTSNKGANRKLTRGKYTPHATKQHNGDTVDTGRDC